MRSWLWHTFPCILTAISQDDLPKMLMTSSTLWW
jgi:hypothetical protein